MFGSSYFNDSRVDEMGKRRRKARRTHRRARRSSGGRKITGQRAKFKKAAKKCFIVAGGKHNFDFTTMGKCMGKELRK